MRWPPWLERLWHRHRVELRARPQQDDQRIKEMIRERLEALQQMIARGEKRTR